MRQLQSILKYAVVQASGEVLTLECLPENLRSGSALPGGRGWVPAVDLGGVAALTEGLLRAGELDIYRRVCLEMDRVVLGAVLRHVKGNQVKASMLLGISRTTLRAKLRALNLDSEKPFPPEPEESE